MPIQEVFQFVAASHPSLNRILPTIPDTPQCVIFDLEDSVQDAVSPFLSATMKNETRTGFLAVASSIPLPQRLNFRIHAWKSSEFEADVRFLEACTLQHQIGIIILPKLLNGEDIRACYHRFASRNIFPREIIPIIETQNAFENLLEILRQNEQGFNRAFFGHHDYYLDSGEFPFPDSDSKSYWSLIRYFIKEIEKAGCSYVHGAITELENESIMERTISRLSALCTKPFSITALSRRQAKFLLKLKHVVPALSEFDCHNIIYSFEEKVTVANRICSLYEQHFVQGTGIAIFEGRLISPHEYRAAKHFLHTTHQETIH